MIFIHPNTTLISLLKFYKIYNKCYLFLKTFIFLDKKYYMIINKWYLYLKMKTLIFL